MKESEGLTKIEKGLDSMLPIYYLSFIKHILEAPGEFLKILIITCNPNIYITSTLRLLALSGLQTLRVRTRTFGPRVGEKLSRILEISAFLSFHTQTESAYPFTPILPLKPRY